MPTYEYFCEECGTNFEAVQKFSDAPLSECPGGHGGVRRVFAPAGIIFKGSGWYIKDSKSSTASLSSSSSTKSTSSDGGEANSNGTSKSEASSTSTEAA